MRLEELYLDGFGHFYQQTIGPTEGSVTVFHGPNEAGKSTLLAFIRAILFGFPTRFNSHYPPLAGGRHGGRIKLSNDMSRTYTVERFAGTTGGLRVITPTGPASDAEILLRQLIGPTTSDFFRTVFAFSLDELQEVASPQGSSIYSAGQGAPGFPALRRSLDSQKSKIYRARGSSQEVPKLLNTLKGLDEQLKAVEGNARRYGELTARKSEIDLELDGAGAELSRLDAGRVGIGKLLDGWEDWVALAECEARLGVMPQFQQFPEDPVARLENLEEQARQAHGDLDEGTEQLQQTREAASAVIPDESLLDDASTVESIRRARTSFDSSVRDLPERQSELCGLEADLVEGLGELGHGWGETELEALDTSMVVRSQADSWKQRMATSLERGRQARVSLDQEQRKLQDLQLELQEVREKMPPEPPPLDSGALTKRQGALRAAKGRLDEYERERVNHRTLVGQLNTLTSSREPPDQAASWPSLVFLILLGLVGAAFIGAGIWLGGNALPLGIVGGLILLAIAAILFLRAKESPSAALSPMATALGQQTADAEAAVEKSRQLLLQSAAALGLTEQPDAATLESAEAALEAARSALGIWNTAQARVEEACRREKSQEQRVETATQKHEHAQASTLEAQQEWQEWLGERGLDKSLTADRMTTFLTRVDATRGSLAEARRMRDRVTAIKRAIDEFRKQVEPLARRHGVQLNPLDRRQLAVVADELIERLEVAQSRLSRREQAKESEEESQRQLERQEQRLQSVKRELRALLTSGGTEDPEEFRRRARQHRERLILERQRDEHLRNLERLSDPDDTLAAFLESLSRSDAIRLKGESDRLLEQQAAIDKRRDTLREERGGINNELDQLTGEEESSALRVRRNALLEQLRGHAREWSRLTIAETLLEKTRQRFERERQPSVIRHAQSFFSSVTGRRYHRLYAPIGERTITVTDSTGGSKQPAELSRGTREQLYLALRFGLIREFGEHAEGLPVVVDEALVNFDPGRARAAVRSFAELSQTNQVLIFTCHPATADMFHEVAGAQVVNISQRTS